MRRTEGARRRHRPTIRKAVVDQAGRSGRRSCSLPAWRWAGGTRRPRPPRHVLHGRSTRWIAQTGEGRSKPGITGGGERKGVSSQVVGQTAEHEADREDGSQSGALLRVLATTKDNRPVSGASCDLVVGDDGRTGASDRRARESKGDDRCVGGRCLFRPRADRQEEAHPPHQGSGATQTRPDSSRASPNQARRSRSSSRRDIASRYAMPSNRSRITSACPANVSVRGISGCTRKREAAMPLPHGRSSASSRTGGWAAAGCSTWGSTDECGMANYLGSERGRFDHFTYWGRSASIQSARWMLTNWCGKREDTMAIPHHVYIYESNIYEPAGRTQFSGLYAYYTGQDPHGEHRPGRPSHAISARSRAPRAGKPLGLRYRPGSDGLDGAGEIALLWSAYDRSGKSLVDPANSAHLPAPEGPEGGHSSSGEKRCVRVPMDLQDQDTWACEIAVQPEAHRLAVLVVDELGRTDPAGIRMLDVRRQRRIVHCGGKR